MRIMKQAQKEEDRVEVGSNQYFDINTDQLIDMRRIMKIAGVSRSTLERWIRDGKFPQPHFKFGGKTARWVERLVLDFIRENWVVKKPA